MADDWPAQAAVCPATSWPTTGNRLPNEHLSSDLLAAGLRPAAGRLAAREQSASGWLWAGLWGPTVGPFSCLVFPCWPSTCLPSWLGVSAFSPPFALDVDVLWKAPCGGTPPPKTGRTKDHDCNSVGKHGRQNKSRQDRCSRHEVNEANLPG